jgi:Secretion system C-terminal sorting domain
MTIYFSLKIKGSLKSWSPKNGMRIAAFMVCLFWLATATAQNLPTVTGKASVYPVKPETKAWLALQSHDEMIQACTIPMERLNALMTIDLIATIFDYPLLQDYTAYDNLAMGFSEMTTQSNLFAALYKRADAGKTLLKIYQATQPNSLDKSWTMVQKGHYAMNIQSLEMLLSQPAILTQFSKNERQTLVKEAFLKAKSMQMLPDIYGSSAHISQLYLMVKAMNIDKYAPTKMNDLKESLANIANPANGLAVKQILGLANEYIGGGHEQLAIAPCVFDISQYTAGTSVLTPNNTSVPTVVYCALSSAQFAGYLDFSRTRYPNATIVSNPTSKYNCHSYAWYNSSNTNDKWMNDPSKYWEDCSYSLQNGWEGEKICYKTSDNLPSHSAILLNASTQMLRSKWGAGALMEHKYNYCPYPNTTIYTYKRVTTCPTMTGLSTTNITGTTAVLRWTRIPCINVQLDMRLKNKIWNKLAIIPSSYNSASISGWLSRNTCYEWRITPLNNNVCCATSYNASFCTTNSATMIGAQSAPEHDNTDGATIELAAPDMLSDGGVTVMPNPTEGLFSVALDAAQPQATTLNIFDITGKSVYEQKVDLVKGYNIFDLQLHLLKGNYIVKIKADGRLASGKIVIY